MVLCTQLERLTPRYYMDMQYRADRRCYIVNCVLTKFRSPTRTSRSTKLGTLRLRYRVHGAVSKFNIHSAPGRDSRLPGYCLASQLEGAPPCTLALPAAGCCPSASLLVRPRLPPPLAAPLRQQCRAAAHEPGGAHQRHPDTYRPAWRRCVHRLRRGVRRCGWPRLVGREALLRVRGAAEVSGAGASCFVAVLSVTSSRTTNKPKDSKDEYET